MNKLFDDEILDVLEYAHKLFLIGETHAAKKLFRRCVEKEALFDGEDMLVTFYGNYIYDSLNRLEDALTYIYISKIATKTFSCANATRPASNQQGWSKRVAPCNNIPLCDAFRWLQQKNRALKKEDSTHFESILSAISSSSHLSFEMSESVCKEKLTSIIKGLVNGKITITATGKLQ